MHQTDEEGKFSIEVGSGVIAAAASAANHSSDEVEPSSGVPGSASFTLHPLRYFWGTLRDASGSGVAGAFIRVRNLDSDRSIHVDSYSTEVSDEDGSFQPPSRPPDLVASGPNWKNQTIWMGDNLDIMRGMNSERVDLIYLDPPFNSNRTYSAPMRSL